MYVNGKLNIDDPIPTYTTFNFNQKLGSDYKGIGSSDFGLVVHEMRHMFDFEIGNMRDDTFIADENNPTEIRGVFNENIARYIQRMQLRTSYGGIDKKKLSNPPNNFQEKKK